MPAPIPNTAAAGYFSEQAVEGFEQLGMDPHLAVGWQKHHEAPVPSKAAAPPTDASVKEKMQHKLRLATGKALYSVRSSPRGDLGFFKGGLQQRHSPVQSQLPVNESDDDGR